MERQTYTYDEAFEASLQYFKGDELAARVWVNKYAVKDSFGNIFEKSPEDMHWRIANEVARIEAKYKNGLNAQQLYELLDHFKYIVPQGSPMTGIGNDFQVASLSNCFVIGIDGAADSYGGIIRIDEEQVQLMKRRGGVGHDLSHIRPKGSPVKNSALTSTGLVPFMERYSNSTREVAQDGRRGALMLSVSIKHPDSEAFIDAKMTEGKVTGANVSVKLDDAFMQAAVNGTPYKQQYPVDSDQPVFTKDIDASALWKKIVHNAWKSAEPGVLFWDTIIRESVPDCYADLGYRTVSTNPCGEIPLCPYDSCVSAHVVVKDNAKIKAGDILIKIPRAVGKSGGDINTQIFLRKAAYSVRAKIAHTYLLKQNFPGLSISVYPKKLVLRHRQNKARAAGSFRLCGLCLAVCDYSSGWESELSLLSVSPSVSSEEASMPDYQDRRQDHYDLFQPQVLHKGSISD